MTCCCGNEVGNPKASSGRPNTVPIRVSGALRRVDMGGNGPVYSFILGYIALGVVSVSSVVSD